jgi:hypothetical protein
MKVKSAIRNAIITCAILFIIMLPSTFALDVEFKDVKVYEGDFFSQLMLIIDKFFESVSYSVTPSTLNPGQSFTSTVYVSMGKNPNSYADCCGFGTCYTCPDARLKWSIQGAVTKSGYASLGKICNLCTTQIVFSVTTLSTDPPGAYSITYEGVYGMTSSDRWDNGQQLPYANSFTLVTLPPPPPPCTPETCSSLGKQCGTWGNGCGGTISCGTCPTTVSFCDYGSCESTETCGNNLCGESESTANCCQDCGCPTNYQCSGSSCVPISNPCAGVTCPDTCEGNMRKYGGSCVGGNCYYNSEQCQGTCNNGVCQSPLCPTCTSPIDWSQVQCLNNIKTRTNYRCDASTSYQCQQFTETQNCQIVCLDTVNMCGGACPPCKDFTFIYILVGVLIVCVVVLTTLIFKFGRKKK